jgi:hypothetical protein
MRFHSGLSVVNGSLRITTVGSRVSKLMRLSGKMMFDRGGAKCLICGVLGFF